MKANLLLAPVVFGVAIAWAQLSHAGGEIWDTTVNTQTGANAGAVVIGGTVKAAGGVSAGKWVAEVYAAQNECLRLHVTAQGTDLETVVVAPNGTVYRNDDGGGACPLCPLVKINPAPKRGWYTVSIGHWAGNPVTADFTLRYGRFNGGNPNCATPTQAQSETAVRQKPAGAASGPAPEGGPSQ